MHLPCLFGLALGCTTHTLRLGHHMPSQRNAQLQPLVPLWRERALLHRRLDGRRRLWLRFRFIDDGKLAERVALTCTHSTYNGRGWISKCLVIPGTPMREKDMEREHVHNTNVVDLDVRSNQAAR